MFAKGHDIVVVLAITITSMSTFNIGGRVIDENLPSLLSYIVEALVITNDWIESKSKRSK